jgi:general stress protein CsbA
MELKSKQHYEDDSKKEDDVPKEPNDVPFWSTNPNIIFHKDHILEFFPTDEMSFNQKLNAITRVVLLMTLGTFAYTQSMQILLVGVVSMFFIFMLYQYKNSEGKGEGFEMSPVLTGKDPITGEIDPTRMLIDASRAPMDSVFQAPSASNPLGNVLVTDYLYNPKRKPAPPAYNESVSANITEKAKQMVINNNPNNPDIAEKLFKDLGDQYMFEQSMQPFYSTASTTIPNDQESFSEFCYGGMVSCKEGNAFACARNNATNYNLH